MQSALDRRQAIKDKLIVRRFMTMRELQDEFEVSRSTIRRDIDILSESIPLYTEKGNGGGVRVMDGYRSDRIYLNSEQEDLLNEIMPGLQPKQMEVMQSILATFGKPKIQQAQTCMQKG